MQSPPFLPFRNGHINTILGNNGPRKWLIKSRAESLEVASQAVELTSKDGVRLHCVYTAQPQARHEPSKGLVILIHGWEGCSQSIYLLSAAERLYREGYDVARLHMRDHGPSHHLNEAPFLAVRIDEIADAVGQICAAFPNRRSFLVGFSLGGNVAARVASIIGSRTMQLEQVLAVCPPIDPEQTGFRISRHPIYNRYFLNKWQASFRKKMALYESFKPHGDLLSIKDLMAMHEAFVPRFSVYPNASEYFKAYSLDARTLPKLDVPCHILLVRDDPVIDVKTAVQLPEIEGLSVEVADYGGHCGFVSSYRLDSWLDDYLVARFAKE